MTDTDHKKYKSSVIIPVFNQEDSLENGVLSLKNQGIEFEDIQIILIDDGSTDKSPYICDKLSEEYNNILCIHQENNGVSAARNAGIRHAKGKYIVFLDADDKLAENTIKNLVEFYDQLDDDVDLITYPIETYFNGKRVAPHFRYKVLTQTGVYSLRDYAFIGQTTMNIVVKNRFKDNVFFDVNQTFSEDQKYCCDVLGRTLKMGFCKDGTYIYFRSHQSTSGKLSGSCYIFEQCTSFFENLFSRYEEVPLAFQGLYVNDFYWKLVSGILLPYHYEKEEYEAAWKRLTILLGRCRNDVILGHPGIDYFEKYFLLRIKPDNHIRYLVSDNKIELFDGSRKILEERAIEAVITKVININGKIHIDGFLKSAFFQFYDREMLLTAIENETSEKLLDLTLSAHSYYRTHEPTQKFKAFRYICDPSEVKSMKLSVSIDGYHVPVKYYFMPLVSLSHINKHYECVKGGIKIKLDHNNTFRFYKGRVKNKEQIWLYYDCVGVAEDNGHLQFEHDLYEEDNIARYYIVTDAKQIKQSIPNDRYIEFGSKAHKQLLRKCSKIITAFIEESNILPYESYQIESESKYFDFEVIYLQHGVLHAIMPWKYAREKLMADRVVVSTVEEADLWKSNGFDSTQLIRTGMPRFEKIHRVNGKRRILYAPSWRQYLVGGYVDHKWQPMDNRFLNSSFYQRSREFIQSEVLAELLERYDYHLDLQLHPIFRQYEHYYTWKSSRISFRDTVHEDGEYDLMITDYSSYEYNFHYLNIPVIHFMPDLMEFSCGMNGYRQINQPKGEQMPIYCDSNDLIGTIMDFLKNGDQKRVVEDRFYRHESIRKEIYKELHERGMSK